MNISKYRVIIPAAVFACFFAASSALAQGNLTIRGDSGSGDAFLGIGMEDVTASNMPEYGLSEEKGAIVRSVHGGSPAEDAGLREGDVILEFAGQPVLSARQLSRLVTETPVGRTVPITVSRNGNRVNLTAALAARPQSASANRVEPRFLDMTPAPGDQLERFFGTIPGYQFFLQRPEQPEAPGGRQNTERPGQGPRLGVEVQPLTDQMAEHLGVPGNKGVLIVSVIDGSASEGRLRAGDVVIGVDGHEVASPADLTSAVQEAASGEISVRIVRDKKQLSVGVTLYSDEKRPSGGYRL